MGVKVGGDRLGFAPLNYVLVLGWLAVIENCGQISSYLVARPDEALRHWAQQLCRQGHMELRFQFDNATVGCIQCGAQRLRTVLAEGA